MTEFSYLKFYYKILESECENIVRQEDTYMQIDFKRGASDIKEPL